MHTSRLPLFLCLSAVCLTLVTGCGSAGGDFVGTYKANGTSGFTATGGGSSTGPFDDTLSIREGTDSDLVISWGSCFYSADVKGTTATVRSGTQCTEAQTVNGVVASVTWTIGNGTLTRSGSVVSLNFAGPANLVYDGQTYPGNYSATATLNLVAK